MTKSTFRFISPLFVIALVCVLLVLSPWLERAEAEGTETESTAKVTEKIIMGWLEPMFVAGALDHRLKAKLDSGAKTSSIHALNVEYFEKAQQDWVRFTVHWRPGSDKEVGPFTVERQILEYKKIKLHNQMSMVRPVIELPIVLAGKEYRPKFNLVDRSKFLYPVLLGRKFLREIALIDPSKTFLTSQQLTAWRKASEQKITITSPSQTNPAEAVATHQP